MSNEAARQICSQTVTLPIMFTASSGEIRTGWKHSLSKFPQSAPVPCLLHFDNLTNYFAVLSLDLEELSQAHPPLIAADWRVMQGPETQRDAAMTQNQGKSFSDFLLYAIFLLSDRHYNPFNKDSWKLSEQFLTPWFPPLWINGLLFLTRTSVFYLKPLGLCNYEVWKSLSSCCYIRRDLCQKKGVVLMRNNLETFPRVKIPFYVIVKVVIMHF